MTVATAVPFAATTPEELAELYRLLNALPDQDPLCSEGLKLVERMAATPGHIFREFAEMHPEGLP